jgi:hypothetical protein
MKKTFLVIVSVAFMSYLSGQSINPEVTSSAGGFFQGTNASLSWTIGECVIETFSNTNYILTQGFQQSYAEVSTLVETPEFDFDISVYPNPTSDFFWIESSKAYKTLENKLQSFENLKAELFDLHGRVLHEQNLVQTREKISLKGFAQNYYILNISTDKGMLVKSYKILLSK